MTTFYVVFDSTAAKTKFLDASPPGRRSDLYSALDLEWSVEDDDADDLTDICDEIPGVRCTLSSAGDT